MSALLGRQRKQSSRLEAVLKEGTRGELRQQEQRYLQRLGLVGIFHFLGDLHLLGLLLLSEGSQSHRAHCNNSVLAEVQLLERHHNSKFCCAKQHSKKRNKDPTGAGAGGVCMAIAYSVMKIAGRSRLNWESVKTCVNL